MLVQPRSDAVGLALGTSPLARDSAGGGEGSEEALDGFGV